MELLTVKETADLLRVSTVTVRRYIASGKLAAVRVGRNVRIRRESVMNVIEPVMKFDETNTWGYGKSDEWIREHIDEHPLMQLAGLIKDDGPNDYSVNHDKYLAEAYADTHEEVEPALSGIDTRFADKSDEWLLENHPWLKLAGVFEDPEGKTDISENHDFYLAEAYADLHEE
jgi:excisionase family DNA binding protein